MIEFQTVGSMDIATRARRNALMLLLAAMALRAIIPVGYMPGSLDGGLLFEMCPEGMPTAMVQALGGKHHHGGGDNEAANWATKTEVIGYAQQDKVSAFNGEQPSAGYGVLNASATWNPWETVRLEVRIDNLFDRSYQNHLVGVNRVVGSDIPVGSRLYGLGRSLSAGLVIIF
jgi:hypothetical protein